MSHPTFWIDVETTGTDSVKNDIIQLALIVDVNGEIKEEKNWKIKPFDFNNIEQSALDVNGITIDELRKYPDALDVLPEILEVFNRYVDKYNKKERAIFGGYYAHFDFDFVLNFFKKCKYNYFFSHFWTPPRDVAILAFEKLADARHELPNFKLGTVAERIGIKPHGNLHDALVDVTMTRDLYYKISTM